MNDPEDDEAEKEYIRKCKKNRYRNSDPRRQRPVNIRTMTSDDRKGKGL